MHRFLLTSIFLFVVILLSGQWNIYEATWKGEPGKMAVQMDWNLQTPLPGMVYLLEFEQQVLNCANGYPRGDEYEKLDSVARVVKDVIGQETYVEQVGKFYYQCQAKDYFYVMDTVGLKRKIDKGVVESYLVKIIFDPEWKVYKDFIYPDPYLEQTMINGRIIEELMLEGIDLEEKIELMHHASFLEKNDRGKFQTFLIEQNFKVLVKEEVEDAVLPYRIYFSRKDKPQNEQLSNITLRIHKKAKFLDGQYQGWAVELGTITE